MPVSKSVSRTWYMLTSFQRAASARNAVTYLSAKQVIGEQLPTPSVAHCDGERLVASMGHPGFHAALRLRGAGRYLSA